MDLARQFTKDWRSLTKTAGKALELQIYKEVARNVLLNIKASDLPGKNAFIKIPNNGKYSVFHQYLHIEAPRYLDTKPLTGFNVDPTKISE